MLTKRGNSTVTRGQRHCRHVDHHCGRPPPSNATTRRRDKCTYTLGTARLLPQPCQPDCSSMHLPPPCPLEPDRLSPTFTRSFQAQSLASHSNHVLPSSIVSRLHVLSSPIARLPPPPGPFELSRPSHPFESLTTHTQIGRAHV